MSMHEALLQRYSTLYQSVDASARCRMQSSLDLIHRIIDIFGIGQLCFSFNGGKDSTLVLHLIRIVLTQKWKQLQEKKSFTEIDNRESSIRHPATSCEMPTNNLTTEPLQSEMDPIGGILKQLPVLYFDSHDQFPQVRDFIETCKSKYDLVCHVYKCSFVEGVRDMIEKYNTKAIFMGVRRGDPSTDELEHIAPSTMGWPPFLRINPILRWTYADVWSFIRHCEIDYCSLYDHGYTSLGNIYDTVENPSLWRHPADGDAQASEKTEQVRGYYLPAYSLEDGSQERLGRQRHVHTTSKS